jgi:hypothetical protein
MVNWSHTWLMPFNVDKCKVMHAGRAHNKSQHIYTMACRDCTRKALEETKSERDLGVQVSDDLKVRGQVETVAHMANRALGRLKKTFRGRSLVLWRVLYLAYVKYSTFVRLLVCRIEQSIRKTKLFYYY